MLIDLAMSDYEANDSNTESAPQQQVVNGWIARDLLEIIARQQEASADTLDDLVALRVASPPDDRPSRLLVVLTVLLGWTGLFAVAPRLGARPAHSSTESVEPPSRPGAVAPLAGASDSTPPEYGSPTDSGATGRGHIDGDNATGSSL